MAKELPGNNTIKGKAAIYTKHGEEKIDCSNAVVFLDQIERDAVFLPSLDRPNPVISQKGKAFSPEVLPILAGTTVDFANDDDIFHNVFSVSRSKPFDLGIYEKGLKKSVTFGQPGLVKIYCNIHPEMIAYILVLSNPYFAISDKEGNFVIRLIPDGNYMVRVWQRFGEEKETSVSLSGSQEAILNFQLSEEKLSIKHKNKWGKDYPAKY